MKTTSTSTLNKNGGRETRQAYRDRKKEIFELEKDNRSQLIVFRSSQGWWKMGGNSALIYHYRVAPRLRIQTRLRPDTDFFFKFMDGVISLRNLEQLEERLKELNIRVERVLADRWIFSLGYNITPEEMQNIRGAEKRKRDQVNQIILPKVTHPDIFVHIKSALKIAYENVRKMEPEARDAIGTDIVKRLRLMLHVYLRMANGKETEKTALVEIGKGAVTLLNDALILSELKLWELDTCLRFSSQVTELKTLAAKAYEEKGAK